MFCPHCGKQTPERRERASVAVEEAPAADRTDGRWQARPQPRRAPDLPLGEPRRSSAALAGSRVERRPPVTAPIAPATSHRYAPPTHSLIGSYEQAGFGLRYGAWMFDFLITLIAMMTFTFAVTAVSHRSVVGSNRDLVMVALLTLLLFVLNFVVLAGANGQSAGMRILGIRIVRVDGRRFRRRDAAVRHLLGYPLSIPMFFLGFLWMLWDPRQQAWHDKLARTIVVMSR